MASRLSSPTSPVESPGEKFNRLQKSNPYPGIGINLTGLPRRVKDSCADVYNAGKRWEKTKLQGARTLRKIAALKADEKADEVRLGELCEDLMKTVEDLAKIVDSISSVRKNFEALVKIDRLKAPTEGAAGEIPFLSFPLEKYLVMIQSVEEVYLRELELKRCLITRVPLQNRQALFTFMNVVWLHDALITEDTTRTVLAIVAECGFK